MMQTGSITASQNRLQRSAAMPSGGDVVTETAADTHETGAKRKRLFRRWFAAGVLLVAAVLAVLYVSNAIAVNDLLEDITSLEADHREVLRENEQLRAELYRLMSVERVTAAAQKLGLVQPDQPPTALPLGGGILYRNNVRRSSEAE